MEVALVTTTLCRVAEGLTLTVHRPVVHFPYHNGRLDAVRPLSMGYPQSIVWGYSDTHIYQDGYIEKLFDFYYNNYTVYARIYFGFFEALFGIY